MHVHYSSSFLRFINCVTQKAKDPLRAATRPQKVLILEPHELALLDVPDALSFWSSYRVDDITESVYLG